jgi:hypothetical protein
MPTIRSRTLERIHSLLLLPLLCVAAPAAAQQAVKPDSSRDTVYLYQVEVAESMIRSPTEAPQTCTAREKDPIKFPVDTTVKNRQDTLVVRVVSVSGTTRTPIKPPADVDVYVGTRRRTLVTGADSLRLTANARQLAGQRVTVQEPNTGRVFCSLTLGTPAAAGTKPAPGAARPAPDAEAVVSIGASFDFLDGMRANDLYSDVRVFIPALWNPASGWLKGRRVGVQAGIYQGRVSSASSTPDSLLHFSVRNPVLPIDTTGGLLVRLLGYERHESRRENTLGLYFGLNVEIGRDLYWVFPHIEVRKEDLRISIRDTVVLDTLIRVPRTEQIRNPIAPTRRVIGLTDYIPTFMTGPRLDMHRESFNLVLQPLWGATLIDPCDYLPGSQRTVDRCDGQSLGFLQYNVTFELEAAKSGIKLGGEVRGYGTRDPDILIFLAKEFTIERFADFFTGSK